ncbi:hypothetical protein [Nocardia terpenica]|uniref:Uncharacterized protein n=1 Tax=Nocardia terpenica TaxID=455432 RepID=A0A6G9Z5S8_9NOCA|nr:hypothetical protein [Nocardia terpenica]QIS20824.1 hypothetical protein F6W96_23430 [Nocardia terpenica]
MAMHGALPGSLLDHVSAVLAVISAIVTGTYVTFAYRHMLGRILASRAMAPFATRGVYDRR